MKNSIRLISGSLFCLCVSFSAMAQTKPAPPKAPILKNGNDSLSYAIGMNIGETLVSQGLGSELNAELIKRAIQEKLQGKPALLNEQVAMNTLQQKLQEAAQKKVVEEKNKGIAYLTANKKRAGVTTLPNGLQYEIIKPGQSGGSFAQVQDTVVVHYKGMLTDGSVFDGSEARGVPATFPLRNVIKGWTEILQIMPLGSKWRVYIPSDLAYGDRGYMPKIKPGATLIFDIELLEIKPAKP